MKIQQNPVRPRQQWLKKPMTSGVYRKWLIDDGSLTARLKARYADFYLQPVLLKNARSFTDESALLELKSKQLALIREVLLMGNNQAVVFAHSVLPRESLRGAWLVLGKLGSKPLGATLFANPKVKRSPLQYKKLPRLHPLCVRVAEQTQIAPKAFWARRSVFNLNLAKILVVEVFLEALIKEPVKETSLK